MSDVEVLFRQLVRVLAKRDPDAVYSPFQIAELYQDLVPYRGVRRELGFEAVEDYEMAVLRLLAGDGGFASVDPPEVQQALHEEAESVNPNPGAFREFAAAYVHLARRAVTSVLDPDQDYAPPPARPAAPEERAEAEGWEEVETGPAPVVIEPHAVSDEQIASVLDEGEGDGDTAEPPFDAAAGTGGRVFEAIDEANPTRCADCNAELPRGRRVVFCPYCAKQLEAARCRQCGDDVEPGWQYCVTCGHPVTG